MAVFDASVALNAASASVVMTYVLVVSLASAVNVVAVDS